MADVEIVELNGSEYDISDLLSRATVAKALASIADTFSESLAYAVDDKVIYNGELYKFTAVHSAGVWNASHATKVTMAELIDILSATILARSPIRITGNASAGSAVTFTDARIDSHHWRIPKNGISFGTPSNVTSAISWSTNPTNHTVTLTGTFAGATTVDLDLFWYQDAQS